MKTILNINPNSSIPERLPKYVLDWFQSEYREPIHTLVLWRNGKHTAYMCLSPNGSTQESINKFYCYMSGDGVSYLFAYGKTKDTFDVVLTYPNDKI